MRETTAVKSTTSVSRLCRFTEPADVILISIGIIFAAVTGLCIPAFNYLFGQMLNKLNGTLDQFIEEINKLCIYFVILAAVNFSSGFIQAFCWTVYGERQALRFGKAYMKAIMSQEIGWFDNCSGKGLAIKAVSHISKIQIGLGSKLGEVIQFTIQFVGAYAVAFTICWKLAMVLLCFWPLVASSGICILYLVKDTENKVGNINALAGGIVEETLRSIRTVMALNIQPEMISRYLRALNDSMQYSLILSQKVGLCNGILFGAIFGMYAIGFWYADTLVVSDREHCDGKDCLSGGDVISTFFCVIFGTIGIVNALQPFGCFVAAKVAVQDVEDILNRKPQIDGMSVNGIVPKEVMGNVEFRDVCFAYPSRPEVSILCNINLQIKPGETIAFVGSSGCGKSTITNLIMRFYDPTSGVVSLDGIDIKDLNLQWHRSIIGYVGQEPVLFAGSVADNIAIGLENAGVHHENLLDLIFAAAKLANAHDFIVKFPDGYDTQVGANGVTLSGGQKQRIALARALIKKPIILILDEATSALDPLSERMVQDSIDSLQNLKTQTTIVIAHRLSTIKSADRICVISSKGITEMGNHDELIERKGYYFDLTKLQNTDHCDVIFENDSRLETSAFEVPLGTAALSASTDNHLTHNEVNAVERIWKILKLNQNWMIIACVGSAVWGATFPLWGFMLAKEQNLFSYSSSKVIMEKSRFYSEIFALMAITTIISNTFLKWGLAQVSHRFCLLLNYQTFESTLRRDIAYFDKHLQGTSVLSLDFTEDACKINSAFGHAFIRRVQAMSCILTGLCLAFHACWREALVLIALLPMNIFAAQIQTKNLNAMQGGIESKNIQSSENGAGIISGSLDSIMSVTFSQIRTVAAFSMQSKILEYYASETSSAMKRKLRGAITTSIAFGASKAVLFLTYAILFWYGGQLLHKKQVVFVDLLTTIFALMMSVVGLGIAVSDIGDFKEATAIATRLFEDIDDSHLSPINGTAFIGLIPSSKSEGFLEFQNVQFSYPLRSNIPACLNFSLRIERGETVAFAGPSGCGKSTIISLLLRFYDPQSGSIRLDGSNISDLNVCWLRSQVGYVGQEPVLFNGSIHSNLTIGRELFEDYFSLTEAYAMDKSLLCGCATVSKRKYEEIERNHDVELGGPNIDHNLIAACIASNAHDFISSFPDGYNTVIGEGGVLLSGGQKQRIAIARALIKNPSILILDEATSALDSESEKMVQKFINELQQTKARTTIIVAHRLSTIKNADKIVVMNNGRVECIGRHEQLLLDSPLYSELWRLQFEEM